MKILKYTLGVVLCLLLMAVLWGYQADIPVQTLQTKYTDSASKFSAINGSNVHYRDEGTSADSIPLVLIHGTGSSLLTWNGWVAALGHDYRIIRLDLPAYGLTGPNEKHDYSNELYISTIHQLLDQLKVKQCYIAGNSLGGGVAWRFALAHPERVKKMILIDASGMATQPKSVPIGFRLAKLPLVKDLFKKVTPRMIIESSLKNVYFDDTKVTPALIDTYWQMTLREGNRDAFVARMRQSIVSPADVLAQIKTIQIPTLIMWGQHDELITTEAAKGFAAVLPNDTLVVYPNAGHVPMEEIPAQSAADARWFLKYFKR